MGGSDGAPAMSETKKKAAAEAAEEVELAKSTDGEKGLTTAQAQRAFEIHGPNELAEKKISPLMQFLGYLCVAALVGGCLRATRAARAPCGRTSLTRAPPAPSFPAAGVRCPS